MKYFSNGKEETMLTVKVKTIRSFVIVIVCLPGDFSVNKRTQLYAAHRRQRLWQYENASPDHPKRMSNEFCDNRTTHVNKHANNPMKSESRHNHRMMNAFPLVRRKKS